MTDENYTDENDATGTLSNMDFNVDDEYKPEPLVPKGAYHAGVTNVVFNAAGYNIMFSLCLHDNGGVMNDGETQIDGSYVTYNVWLPKPGDGEALTKSGKYTKRQWKINALRDLGADLEINVSTPQAIAEAIENAEWVGMEVDVDTDIDEYQGKFRTVANRMRKSKMY